MALGIDCNCPAQYQIRSKDHNAGRPARCPECGKIYRLPRRPRTILAAADADEEVCVLCGKGFSFAPQASPVRIGKERYRHQACHSHTPRRKESRASDSAQSPSADANQCVTQDAYLTAPLTNEIWDEFFAGCPSQPTGGILRSPCPSWKDHRWFHWLITIGAAVPIAAVLLIGLDLLLRSGPDRVASTTAPKPPTHHESDGTSDTDEGQPPVSEPGAAPPGPGVASPEDPAGFPTDRRSSGQRGAGVGAAAIVGVLLFFGFLLVISTAMFQGACRVCGEMAPDFGKAMGIVLSANAMTFMAGLAVASIAGEDAVLLSIPINALIISAIYSGTLNTGFGKGFLVFAVQHVLMLGLLVFIGALLAMFFFNLAAPPSSGVDLSEPLVRPYT